jgi:hypothetical protein
MAKKKRKQGVHMTPALKKRVWDAVRARHPSETIKAIAADLGVSAPTVQRIATALKKEREARGDRHADKAVKKPKLPAVYVRPIRVTVADEAVTSTHYANRVIVDSSGKDLSTLALRLEEMARVLRSTREAITGGDVIVAIRTGGR